MKNRSHFVYLIVSVVFLEASATSVRAQSYQIRDLGILKGGSNSYGYGVNALGDAVGAASTSGSSNYRATVSIGGKLYNLGTLGGTDSYSNDVNALRHVVGSSLISNNSERHAFFHVGTGPISASDDMGTLEGGSVSQPNRINNADQVVGYAYTADGSTFHGFLHNGHGSLQESDEVGTLGGPNCSVNGINDKGDYVGASDIANDEGFHAFRHIGSGNLTPSDDLGALGGTYSRATAINMSGQVVGEAGIANNVTNHAFCHSGSGQINKKDDLGTLGGDNSIAYSINNFGQVVGGSDTTNNASYHAFIYQNKKLADLNAMIPSGSDWELQIAWEINEAGQIVGSGLYNGQPHAFLLTPSSQPPPTGLTLTDDSNHPVVGIVCDNPVALGDGGGGKDELIIHSDSLKGATNVVAILTNDDGSQTDRAGHINVGHFWTEASGNIVVLGNGTIFYYPPDEFNYEQEPIDIKHDVTKTPTRTVHLNLSFNKDKKQYAINELITLARPPVVLVHGINSSPANWTKMISALAPYSFPVVTVNHNNPKKYNIWDLMHGNGPVEFAAMLLKERIDTTLSQIHAGKPVTDADENTGDEVNTFEGYPGALAAKRVDVVAWSYGGVITRWYIASTGKPPSSDWPWYKRKYSFLLPSKTAYGNDIHKVITLDSMWRGVPLINYVNEASFADDPHFTPANGIKMGDAPLDLPVTTVTALFPLTVINYVRDFVDALDAFKIVRTLVPSMEVMAVNSPWQCQMIYGQPDPATTAHPFDDIIAYAAIAGDDNAYVPTLFFDPHALIDDGQQPTWFPYLRLERRNLSLVDLYAYSDGLVPVWSSAIPLSYQVILVDHSSCAKDQDVQNLTMRWLSTNNLPEGKLLNKAWNDVVDSTITNYDGEKTWQFRPGEMAPHAQNDIYTQVENGRIGRINPYALKEINNLTNTLPNNNSVTISYNTATDTDTLITLYVKQFIGYKPVSSYQSFRFIKFHQAIFNNLKPHTTYYFDAKSTLDNAPDDNIVVSAGKQSFYNP